jgi:hypothetical protein
MQDHTFGKCQRSPAWPWPIGQHLIWSDTSAFDVQRLEGFEGAGCVTDRLGGNVGVARGRAQLGMAEQQLDHPHINVGLQQMCREAVPQRMQGGRLGKPNEVLGRIESPAQLPPRDWGKLLLAWKQPPRRLCLAPIIAQQVQQIGRQHDLTGRISKAGD